MTAMVDVSSALVDMTRAGENYVRGKLTWSQYQDVRRTYLEQPDLVVAMLKEDRKSPEFLAYTAAMTAARIKHDRG